MNPANPGALVLRDIHLPDAPSLWPPAPGWWLLGAVLLALLTLLGWTGWRWVRQRRARRQRQRVLDALAALEVRLTIEPSPARLAGIGELLRRVALSRYPHRRVAALHGGAWLRFLDDTGGQGRFRNGPGGVLGDGPYRRALPADLDLAGLMALVRDWVDHHPGSPA